MHSIKRFYPFVPEESEKQTYAEILEGIQLHRYNFMTIPGIYLANLKGKEEMKKVRFKSDSERIKDLEKKVEQLDSLLHIK